MFTLVTSPRGRPQRRGGVAAAAVGGPVPEPAARRGRRAAQHAVHGAGAAAGARARALRAAAWGGRRGSKGWDKQIVLRFTLSSGLIFTDLKISVRCALRHVSITLLASIAFSVSRSGRVLGRQARLNTLVLCSVWPVYAIIYLKINVTFLT